MYGPFGPILGITHLTVCVYMLDLVYKALNLTDGIHIISYKARDLPKTPEIKREEKAE